MSDLPPIFPAASRLLHKLGRRLARIALLGMCGALASMPAALADETATHMPPPAALEHYNRGRAHYQAGRYREAVEELEEALTLDPGSPNLVYNLARVYELLGDIDRALPHYAHYRDMLPSTAVDERARVEGTLARLRGARDTLAPKPAPERPELQLRPPNLIARSERGVADGAFWTLATVSLAALTAGGVLGVMALRDERDALGFVLGRDGDLAARSREADQADRRALMSDVSFAVGAVGGLTSILLYALRTRTIIEPQANVSSAGFTFGVRGAL
ncbi:MAG TPA: tetratricopeptide repeat protein [Polyangiales bacterium]